MLKKEMEILNNEFQKEKKLSMREISAKWIELDHLKQEIAMKN